MKLFIILAVAIAYAAGECTDMQRLRVKQQWSLLYSTGRERVEMVTAVYKAFFDAKPEAVALFGRVNGENIYSEDFRAHMFRVFGGLDMCLALLDEPEILKSNTETLKEQHKDRAGSGDYINDFFKALKDYIAAQDVVCFDQDAWSNCLTEVGAAIFG